MGLEKKVEEKDSKVIVHPSAQQKHTTMLDVLKQPSLFGSYAISYPSKIWSYANKTLYSSLIMSGPIVPIELMSLPDSTIAGNFLLNVVSTAILLPFAPMALEIAEVPIKKEDSYMGSLKVTKNMRKTARLTTGFAVGFGAKMVMYEWWFQPELSDLLIASTAVGLGASFIADIMPRFQDNKQLRNWAGVIAATSILGSYAVTYKNNPERLYDKEEPLKNEIFYQPQTLNEVLDAPDNYITFKKDFLVAK